MISLDTRTRSKLIWVGAMLTPIIGVQLVRVATSSRPQPAAAAPVVAEAPPPPPPPVALTPGQHDAMRWLMERGAKPPTRSPMDRMDPPPVEVKVEAPVPEPVRAPKGDDTPRNAHLTGVIGNGKNALASIDHKVRRVGDVVAPNWKVASIDSRNHQVLLRSTDGREFMLVAQHPDDTLP